MMKPTKGEIMTVGSVAKTTGRGLLKATGWITINAWNAPRQARIDAIDRQIEALQEERAQLVGELIDESDSQ